MRQQSSAALREVDAFDCVAALGNQHIGAVHFHASDELTTSREVDLIPKTKKRDGDKLNAIAEGSDFHGTHGVYVAQMSCRCT